ncbi:MAG: winged helix-turn-helix domain-containing protein [Chloroflexi bacterium]|nr:winged helix-turn-helix domain-containing protein [Chloroflexota bacterium]
MDYPEAVIEKAKRHEELLQRVAGGKSRVQVCTELGINVDEERFAVLRAKYETGGRTWQALLDGRHGHAKKVHSAIREWLYERKEQDEDVRAPALVGEVEERFGVKVSDGHINYLLRKRGLTAPPGRPYKRSPAEEAAELITESPESLDNAGIFFPGGSEARDGGAPGS